MDKCLTNAAQQCHPKGQGRGWFANRKDKEVGKQQQSRSRSRSNGDNSNTGIQKK